MSTSPRSLILASTSPYRRQLLERLQLPFEAVAPDFEEVDVPGLSALEQVEHRARGKAESLRERFPDALIIGSDQELVIDDAPVGKSGSHDGACAQLRRQSGQTLQLITALALLDSTSGRLDVSTAIHTLTFRELSDDAIETYVRLDKPYDCAGSFKIESLGIALFEHIEGEDPAAIMGLPMMRLVKLLTDFGLDPLAPRA